MRKLALLLLAMAACGGSAVQDSGTDALTAQVPHATLVMLHGWGGFLRSGELDYFHGVPELYRSLGATVYIPSVPPVNTIEVRAQKLKEELDQVEGPLILIAHSQGGLDARWLVSKLGYDKRVLAVITIATPHHGTQVGDFLAGIVPAPVRVAVNDLLKPFNWSVDGIVEMSVSYMEGTFNSEVPDAPGVTYWSWSGKAAPFGWGNGDGDLHLSLIPGWTLLRAFGVNSDGVVPEASAHWGEFQGTVLADHLSEINHMNGVHPGFDGLGFYKDLLQRLHDQGF